MSLEQKLAEYIPEDSVNVVVEWIKPFPLRLRIAKPRKSKLGDYRPRSFKQPHRISVNGNLDAFTFLITLTHEIAHMMDFEQRKTTKNPHGMSWKRTYQSLLQELQQKISLDEMYSARLKHLISHPSATAKSWELPTQNLDTVDGDLIRLSDIPMGAEFVFNDRTFMKEQLRRTRFVCLDLQKKRQYTIHKNALVSPITSCKS